MDNDSRQQKGSTQIVTLFASFPENASNVQDMFRQVGKALHSIGDCKSSLLLPCICMDLHGFARISASKGQGYLVLVVGRGCASL